MRRRHLNIVWLAPLLAAFAFSASSAITGCGYTLQGSHSELLDKEGIRTVYVKPLTNGTYKPGIENVVYNALVRTLLSHRRVKVVQSEIEADAILVGSVGGAQFSTLAATPAILLAPKFPKNPLPASGVDLGSTTVATIYMASLACDFYLIRNKVPPGKQKLVWSAGFTRNKPFQSANQLDVPGTTSALINESEFERALGEMATSMMDDVNESMLAMF